MIAVDDDDVGVVDTEPLNLCDSCLGCAEAVVSCLFPTADRTSRRAGLVPSMMMVAAVALLQFVCL